VWNDGSRESRCRFYRRSGAIEHTSGETRGGKRKRYRSILQKCPFLDSQRADERKRRRRGMFVCKKYVDCFVSLAQPPSLPQQQSSREQQQQQLREHLVHTSFFSLALFCLWIERKIVCLPTPKNFIKKHAYYNVYKIVVFDTLIRYHYT